MFVLLAVDESGEHQHGADEVKSNEKIK